jgi:membrane protease YdiL (CAAX protease family)
MNAMPKDLRGFMWTLLVVWTLQCIAATVYSQQKDIPASIVLAVVPAFLLETTFYLASGLRATRNRLEKLSPALLATAMTASAPLPYLLYSVPTGVFSWQSLAVITALAGLGSFWFVAAGKRSWTDLLYLLIMAAPILLKTFKDVYADPLPKLQLFVLGVLMWYRTGLLAALSIRRMEGINFGFVPQKRDWAVGVRNFLYFLPLGVVAGFGMGLFGLKPSLGWMLPVAVVGTFVVTLCVLATAEEFFFRGLLQQVLTRLSGSELVGLFAASLIFGIAHMVRYPHWGFILLATCAGVFYGRAFLQAQSVRAAMVTHALVVTVWQVFLVYRA